jgi:hypothetical protein
LRFLRTDHWPDSKLTQGSLAKALAGDGKLSPAAVASWESATTPKLPPRERLEAYAQFFATRRSLGPEPGLVPVDSFTPQEQAAHEELLADLLRLHSAARGGHAAEAPTVVRRSWHFTDTGPLTLVCAQLPAAAASPLARRDNPNYTKVAGLADLDAMVELHGHIRAENSGMGVFFKAAPEVEADDLSGHVVIIGGIAWNNVTRRLIDLSKLPVGQQEEAGLDTGEIFVTQADSGQQKYLPEWSAATGESPRELIQDVGLLVRMPNPLNSNRTLTMCNGIHSRGVLGAVRTLTDAMLRESNEKYIAQHFSGNQFGILMRVQVIGGETLTPDFGTAGTVLYQWPVKALACLILKATESSNIPRTPGSSIPAIRRRRRRVPASTRSSCPPRGQRKTCRRPSIWRTKRAPGSSSCAASTRRRTRWAPCSRSTGSRTRPSWRYRRNATSGSSTASRPLSGSMTDRARACAVPATAI